MEKRIYRFEHGGVSGAAIEVLEPAQWDLNRMLPEHFQLAADSIVTYTYACSFLRVDKLQVLVDAGFYAQEVIEALDTLSVDPADITHVLITHGDRDHVCGLLMESGDLTFPNARHVLSSSLWSYWHDHAALSAMPDEHRTFYLRLASALAERVSTFTDATEFEDGIQFIPCPGHRHGHSTYEFQTEISPILHLGDTLFHPQFAENPHWPDTMALDPEQEIVSRKSMLERAAKSGALVLTGHISFPGLGTIHKQDAAYRWQSTAE